MLLYDISIGATRDVAMKAISAEKVEAALRNLAPQRFGFGLTAQLDTAFVAVVVRNPPAQEQVRLYWGDHRIDLLREGEGEPGDFCVSCSPEGARVPVATINISFRDYEDTLTDRGLVWVRPGNPSEMHFVIDRPALEEKGVVTKLIAEAEEAVRSKLLVRLV